MVSVRESGAVTPLPPVTDAVTSTDLFGASTVLPTAVTRTSPVLSVCPAVMVSSLVRAQREVARSASFSLSGGCGRAPRSCSLVVARSVSA